jgi:hypothetical protein
MGATHLCLPCRMQVHGTLKTAADYEAYLVQNFPSIPADAAKARYSRARHPHQFASTVSAPNDEQTPSSCCLIGTPSLCCRPLCITPFLLSAWTLHPKMQKKSLALTTLPWRWPRSAPCSVPRRNWWSRRCPTAASLRAAPNSTGAGPAFTRLAPCSSRMASWQGCRQAAVGHGQQRHRSSCGGRGWGDMSIMPQV